MNKKLVVIISSMLLFVAIPAAATINETNIIESNSLEEDWWPMFHHDPQHTGYTASTAPLIGKEIWKKTLSAAVGTSSPAVVDGLLYIGTTDRQVYCLDTMDGSQKWSFALGGSVSPAVVNGKVYVSTLNGRIYCLNATDGNPEWQGNLGSFSVSSPTVADGRVYLGTNLGKIYCFNADDGTKIWEVTTNKNKPIPTSPAVVNDKLFVGSYDNKQLYCLNTSDGNLQWTFNANSGVTTSAAVSNDHVYFGTDDGAVYCIDMYGTQSWIYQTGGRVNSTPALAQSCVYFGSADSKMYCLDLNGGLEWYFVTNGETRSSPAVADGKIYIGSDDAYLYCLNATDGQKLSSYKTDDSVRSSPAVADGVVYIGSNDNNVYALREGGGDIEISDITGGLLSVNVVIKNIGEFDANDIDWSISVQGGMLKKINVSTKGIIETLEAGQETIVTTDRSILGFGKITIEVTANEIKKTADGFVLFFFVLVVQ